MIRALKLKWMVAIKLMRMLIDKYKAQWGKKKKTLGKGKISWGKVLKFLFVVIS